jgi:hypothetical protein
MPGARPATIVALVAAACALTACGPAVSSIEATQEGPGAAVRLVTSLCETFTRGSGSGTTTSCSSSSIIPTSGAQALVAYALPVSVTPSSARISGTAAAPLDRSDSYEDWLDANDPAAAGMHWVAYTSPMLSSGSSADGLLLNFTAEIPLPGGEEPLGELPYEVRIGYRTITGAVTEDSAVDCSDPSVPQVCRLGTVTGGPALKGAVPIRDARLARAGTVEADRGLRSVVQVPVRYAGEAASGDLKLATSTDLPGAAVTAPTVVRLPRTQSTTVPVAVDVPWDAKAGDYRVDAQLELPGGVKRSVSVPLHVNPAPAPKATVPALAFTATEIARAAHLDLGVRADGLRAILTRGASIDGPNAADFAVVRDECAPVTLAPNTECRIGVDFLPSAAGARTATLHVPTTGGELTVPLGGQGVPSAEAAQGEMRSISAPTRRSTILAQGLSLSQLLPAAGDVAWRVRLLPEGATASRTTAAPAGTLVAPVVKRRVDAPGPAAVTLKLSKQGRRLLRQRRGARLMVTTAMTDVRGRRFVVRVPLKLRG